MKDVKDKENAKPTGKFGSLFESLSCGQCGAGFANLMEYLGHKKVCIPDENFECEEPKQEPETQSEHKQQENSRIKDNISSSQKEEDKSDQNNVKSDLEREKDSKSPPKTDSERPSVVLTSDKTSKPWVNMGSTNKAPGTNNGLMCDQCGAVFASMVKYDDHRTQGCDNTTQK